MPRRVVERLFCCFPLVVDACPVPRLLTSLRLLFRFGAALLMVERLEEVDLEEADLEEVDLVVVLRALALPVDRLAALVGVFFRITSPVE